MTKDQTALDRPVTARKSVALLVVLVSMSLLVAIAAIMVAFMSFQSLTNFKNEATKTQQQLILQLQQRQQNFNDHIVERLNKNEMSLNQLIAQSSNIPAEQAKQEANYLINLAQLNLDYFSNVSHAIRLLQAASQQLSNFHNADIEIIQQKITHDLLALQKLPQVNRAQILSQLDNLMQAINEIPLLHSLPPATPLPLTTTSEPNSHGFWSQVKNTLAKMKSFIIIQHMEDSTRLAISPDERLLAKQLLILKLTVAQWAVLNKNAAIYQRSLTAAIKLLTVLQSRTTATPELLNTLTQLQTIDIAPPIHIQLTATPINTSVSKIGSGG